MDITLDKNNNIRIKIKKGKEQIVVILTQKPTIEIDDFKISEAGEYEVKGIFTEGISKNEENFYLLNIERVKICYLPIKIEEIGDLNVEKIGDIDILFVDISKFQNNKKLSEIILLIEPEIIIPIYTNEEQLIEFLKARGLGIDEGQDKFSIGFKNLIGEKTKTVILNKT